ncbi:MAG: glycosyl transferase [Prevotella sp.]|nr:glycosyl transferase [Candidatus Prevotella equi]
MIPKIIHFCWFGGNPLPPLALECIASWRKFLPDYEIWMWRDDPSQPSLKGQESIADKVMEFDVNSIPYTAEAYRQKKYAYVSDYARFEIIHKYGGVYFDTDVEVIKPLDDIIVKGCFMGFEQDPDGDNTPGKYAPRYCFDVALGLGFGMTQNHPFMAEMVEHYKNLTFEPIPTGDISWYKTIVAHTTEKLCARGLKNVTGIQKIGDIYVYPSEYFAPINAISRRLHITKNTRTIHRYMASWSEQKNKSLRDYIMHYIPEWVLFWNNKRKRRNYLIKQEA